MSTQLIPTEHDNVVAFRIEDQVSDQDFERIADVIDEKLKNRDNLRMYAQFESFEGMSPTALLKDLKYTVKNFDRFDRAAILSDGSLMGQLAGLEGKLLPGIETRTFELDEKERAMSWLTS